MDSEDNLSKELIPRHNGRDDRTAPEVSIVAEQSELAIGDSACADLQRAASGGIRFRNRPAIHSRIGENSRARSAKFTRHKMAFVNSGLAPD